MAAEGLSRELAEGLPEPVVLEAPVRHVEHSRRGVVVHTDRGTFKGRRAIFAVPPPMLARIRFEPALPPRRAQLLQRIGMGAAIKVIAGYDQAFWRDAGFSGEAVADGRPLSVAYDNTSADGTVANLLGFIVGRPAREYGARPANERKRAVLTQLARWFGDRALDPIEYIEKDWSAETFSGGCPVANFPPGIMCDLGRDFIAPLGALHWAGTETAAEWCGYMEGAVRAGERAADEVITSSTLTTAGHAPGTRAAR